MARISGVDIPDKKRGEIGLTYIFGIGRSAAQKILTQAGVNYDKKVGEWTKCRLQGDPAQRKVVCNKQKES